MKEFPAGSPCREALDRGGAGGAELVLASQRGVLCMLGDGIQTRGSSTVEMLRRAFAVLREQGRELPRFCNLRFSLDDNTDKRKDLGYNGGAPFIVPDFTFLHWREAGLCPDYTALVERLRSLSGSRPPLQRKCGWVGAVNSFIRIRFLNASLEWPHMIEAIWPRRSEGQVAGRHSMEEQVQRYSCLLDGRGESYSGRVPLLLHSGRPLLYAQRSKEFFFDRTFYGYSLPEKLTPWVHFIPIRQDGADLGERLRWVLSPANAEAVENITTNALHFAAKHLTREAAVRYLADKLFEAAKTRPC